MGTNTYKPTADETTEALYALGGGRLTQGQRLYVMDDGRTRATALVRVFVIEPDYDGKPDLVDITHWVGKATGRGLKEVGGRLGVPVSGVGMSPFVQVLNHLGQVLGFDGDGRTGEPFAWEEI